jgi:hypothetical protein
MHIDNFKTSIIVSQSPMEVFNAVNNVSCWWSEEIKGASSKVGDVFNYHFKDIHICKIQIQELIPGKKVVWLVLDNYFSFIGNKEEWKGNSIIFDITVSGNQTQLLFTQEGLVPEYECFEVCEKAWTNYIQNSLYALITRGIGTPNPLEGGFNQELADEMHLENK